MSRQSRKMLIVGGKNSYSASLQTFEDLGFCVGDLGHRVEELDMNRGHPGDDRDIRADEARQRCDLACVVHADLEHAEGRIFRHPRKR